MAVLSPTPALYDELAEWWPLLSPPDEYAFEATQYLRLLRETVDGPLDEVLELGSGGGNNASHMTDDFRMTLVDLSPAMLAVSERLNPECEHVEGDMRSVRLGRTFDGVFVHDAIAYLTTEDDLAAAIETVATHCRPGGAVVLVPDFVAETFTEGSEHGGRDGADRALRYLEWHWDPDPTDTTHRMDLAYLLRHPDGSVEVRGDAHPCGLFARQTWLDLLAGVGIDAEAVPLPSEDEDPHGREAFVGRRPGSDQFPPSGRS
ncbi:MAG: class I SAM-dependent methyltransferase [Solirubrobacterales bacterium]